MHAAPVQPKPLDQERGLRHELSAGQMAMVGVGGSIGTGLLLGSGAAISIAGPSVIFSFLVAALIAWTVAMAMGEMASVHPAAGSFGIYAELYLNPWAGFIARTAYWVSIALAIGAEMVASATYMHLWFPSIQPVVWVAVFALVLLAVNLRHVGGYGRFEYWFAMVKVVTIVAFIVIGAALMFSGRVQPQYAANGGFFPNGHWALFSAMLFSIYTFGGVEMVAITSGESRSAQDLRRAFWLSMGMLTLVYVGAITVLVGVMPWSGAGVLESPFVTVFRQAGLPAASYLMNFVVLSAALSSANACLYSDSRMLFSLARGGYAPGWLGKLNAAGAPVAAVLVSASGIVVALVMEKWAPKGAFVNMLSAAFFGLWFSWAVTLVAHVRFRRQLTPAQVTALPMRSPGGAAASALGCAAMVLALATTWRYSRVTIVGGIIYIALLSVAYPIMRRRRPRGTILN
jgi:AAT family amino acid transporter